jgi:chorismate mutase
MMRLNKKKLALVAALTISAEGTPYLESTRDQLQRLVETSAQRFVTAEQVAFAKWDSGTLGEARCESLRARRARHDASREAQVIASAVKAGKPRGLEDAAVANFFRSQIEANKLVQYSLLAKWRRVGKAPDHASVDLAGIIRPKLDQLRTELVVQLTETAALRASASRRGAVAKAVGKHVSASEEGVSPQIIEEFAG